MGPSWFRATFAQFGRHISFGFQTRENNSGTLKISHCSLYTVHCSLHNETCILYTAHSAMHTAHFLLHTAHLKLHISYYKLHSAQCTLHTAHFVLHTTHRTLHTAHFTLNNALLNCTLQTGPFVLLLHKAVTDFQNVTSITSNACVNFYRFG